MTQDCSLRPFNRYIPSANLGTGLYGAPDFLFVSISSNISLAVALHDWPCRLNSAAAGEVHAERDLRPR